MSEVEKMPKEELHNIGGCLLDCIDSHYHEGGFDNKKEPYYKQDRLVFETVCDIFGLNKKEALEDHGYEVKE